MFRLRRNDLYEMAILAFLAALVWTTFCLLARAQPGGPPPGSNGPPGYFELAQLESNQFEDAALDDTRDQVEGAFMAAFMRWIGNPSPQGGSLLAYTESIWCAGDFLQGLGETHLANEQAAYASGDFPTADAEGAQCQQLFDAAGHCYALAQGILGSFGP